MGVAQQPVERPDKPRVPRFPINRQIVAILLIVIGLALVFFYGARAIRTYHEVQYIREQGLDRGTASVEAIRPWMTIRYVSVAYAVPEEYIFARLGIPYNRRSVNDTLGHLNREFQIGEPVHGEELPIVKLVADAISEYRANPVATGLRDIRPWMTIRYIANSAGVPEAYILERVGLVDEEDAAVRPLGELADAMQIEGGPRALEEAIRAALERYAADE